MALLPRDSILESLYFQGSYPRIYSASGDLIAQLLCSGLLYSDFLDNKHRGAAKTLQTKIESLVLV